MPEWTLGILALVIGGALGAAVTALLLAARRRVVEIDRADARTRAAMLDRQLAERGADIDRVRAELAAVQTRREEAERRLAASAERIDTLERAETRLRESFLATGSEALEANSKQFLALATKTFEGLMIEAKGDAERGKQTIESMVRPIRELLEKQTVAVTELEKRREVAYTSLNEQIRQIASSHGELRAETGRLVTALRRPEQRGRWGEMQLRNVVELAGMSRHCDFHEQPATDDPETRDRPDMIVRMPGGGVIVVDAKVALDAYLDAIQPDADRNADLRRHAEQVERHFKRLAQRRYWEQFERTPRLVVMFMPLESALVAALDAKPDLHAEAMKQHVLIATPTLLVALLHAVAYGWQQEAIADNARAIAKVGDQLYRCVAKFAEHLATVGKGLDRAGDAYDNAVGSLERTLLPKARKLRDLHATNQPQIEPPPLVRIETRTFTAAELVGEPDEAGESAGR